MRRLSLALLAVAAAAVAAHAEDPKVRSRVAKLGAVRVHYDDAGPASAKTAIVLVHGWACDRTVWRLQIPKLAKDVRCLAVDLPGHGQSDKPEATEYSPSLFAKAIDAVVRDAGVEKAVLVAHGSSATAARQFARDFPKKAQALALVDGLLRPFFSDPKQMEQLVARFRGPDYRKRVEAFVDPMFTPQMPADVKASLKAVMLSTPQHVLVSSLEALQDPAVWKDETIDLPVLFVQAHAETWTLDFAEIAKKVCPKLDYHVVEGAGHFVMMEKPGEFDALLVAFLEQQGVLKKKPN
jgi:sigma-B regulation protein RsbQ